MSFQKAGQVDQKQEGERNKTSYWIENAPPDNLVRLGKNLFDFYSKLSPKFPKHEFFRTTTTAKKILNIFNKIFWKEWPFPGLGLFRKKSWILNAKVKMMNFPKHAKFSSDSSRPTVPRMFKALSNDNETFYGPTQAYLFVHFHFFEVLACQ